MLEKFRARFAPDLPRLGAAPDLHSDVDPELDAILAAAEGYSFDRGVYRLIRANDRAEWAQRVTFAFPEFGGRITCFGFDWLGRAFAVDRGRLEGAGHGVVMFEPGTGQALEIPADIETFHDSELVEFGEAALAIEFFKDWQATNPENLGYDQCIGYRKPLFLGGVDQVENLERSTIEVYWNLLGQLIRRLKKSS